MYTLYSALLGLFLLVTLPYWLLQMMRHGKYRAGLRQRLGGVPSSLAARPEKRTIWVHAVSVGEVVASSAVIEALQRKFSNHRVVVSTTTDTGQKLAAHRLGAENVFHFPLDFAFAIRPYLAALRPELVVVAEPKVLNNVDLFLAQTGDDRRRLIEIGAPQSRISVAGNLKFDVAPPTSPAIVASLGESLTQSGAGPVLICGSTLEDEEGPLLSAFSNILANHPKAVMILAPRHPERFSKIAELVEKLGFRLWRRSLWSGESLAGGVFLVDSIGELAALYSLATVAFVGGSLVPRGGHNILEPALYGVPVVTGNHYENFRDIVNYFRERNAVRVVGVAELPLVFMELIESREARQTLARNARAALESQRGATARTVDALVQLMVGDSV